MASLTARRPTLPAAGFAASGPRSPLDQLELGVSMRRDSLSSSSSPPYIEPTTKQPATPTKVIPTLDLNLFRSPSIYSVESGESVTSSDDYDSSYGYSVTSEPESETDDDEQHITFTTTSSTSRETSPVDRESGPSTPRGQRVLSESPLPSGSNTPRGAAAAARKTSTQNLPYAFGSVNSAISNAPFTLKDVPVRSARSLSVSTSATTTTVPTAARSCSAPSPAEPHGHDAPGRYPEEATAPDWASVHGEQGSDWGDDEAGFEWLDTDEPTADVNGRQPSRLRAAIAQPMLTVKRSVSVRSGRGPRSPLTPKADLPNSDEPARPTERRRSKKHHPIVIPRRPAPPPPPGAGYVAQVEQSRSRSPAYREDMGPIRTVAPADDLPPVVIIDATPPRRVDQPNNANSSSSPTRQSLASSYSYYALDSPRNSGIPTGRYQKITLDSPRTKSPESMSPRRSDETHRPLSPLSSLTAPMPPDELVATALERREAGDLPRSAFLFMKAAGEGSVEGRIYYGVALKHG